MSKMRSAKCIICSKMSKYYYENIHYLRTSCSKTMMNMMIQRIAGETSTLIWPKPASICINCVKRFNSYDEDNEKLCEKRKQIKLMLSELIGVRTDDGRDGIANDAMEIDVNKVETDDVNTVENRTDGLDRLNPNAVERAESLQLSTQSTESIILTPRMISMLKANKCMICRRKFKSVHKLRWHLERVHQQVMPLPPFDCIYCHMILDTLPAFREHRQRHMNAPRYQCIECGFKGAPWTYAKHMRNEHSNGVAVGALCDFCGKSYALPCHLKKHLQTHTGEFKYECYLCGGKYRTHEKDYLLYHMRKLHTNERPFVCPECGKRFINYEICHEHRKTHLGPPVKNHKCIACPKAFNRRHLLAKHLRTAHEVEMK